MIKMLIMTALIGFFTWLILQIKMADPIPKIIIGVVVVWVVIMFLQFFGIVTGLPNLRPY